MLVIFILIVCQIIVLILIIAQIVIVLIILIFIIVRLRIIVLTFVSKCIISGRLIILILFHKSAEFLNIYFTGSLCDLAYRFLLVFVFESQKIIIRLIIIVLELIFILFEVVIKLIFEVVILIIFEVIVKVICDLVRIIQLIILIIDRVVIGVCLIIDSCRRLRRLIRNFI